jgi:hypothetical protein
MPPSWNLCDLQNAPEDALELGLAGLERAATGLGAQTVAVLILETTFSEIAYRWTKSDGIHAKSREIDFPLEARKALLNGSGVASAQSPVAHCLTSAVAPAANSFLLFPWQALRRTVIIIFGFAERQPPHTSIPAHVVETLNLAALAAWSLTELNRLRAELRVVNNQFAARKLVERAKCVLQSERGMSEQQAYEYLRKVSRQRRIALAKLAKDLLAAGRWP